MKIKIMIIIACIVMLSSQKVWALSQSDTSFEARFWQVTECNDCTSYQDFKYAASFYTVGNVTIFNLNSGQIKTFKAEMGTTFGSSTPVQIATPQEAHDAFQKYQELKSRFAELTSQDLSGGLSATLSATQSHVSAIPYNFNFGHICGPTGSHWANWIPDGVYAPACSAHDQCYAGGAYSKMFCDDLFLTAMEDLSFEATKNFDIFLKHLSRSALLDLAEFYHFAVVELELAFDAYCDATQNSNTLFV